MQRFRILGLAIFAVLAFSVIAATAAQAEGPFLRTCKKKKGEVCEEGGRLKAGETIAITGKQKSNFVLATTGFTITCTKLKLEKATLKGSEVGTAGSSEETLVFEGCTVGGNGGNCMVAKAGVIKTNAIENWLDKENSVGTKKEHLLVGFKPVTGTSFVEISFEGSECKILAAPIEIAKVGELGVACTVMYKNKTTESIEPVELEVAATEKLSTNGLVECPATLRKVVFVEKGKVVSEIKEKLTAAGKTVTAFTGSSELTSTLGLDWGVFGK